MEKRVRFDFEITFVNGGGLQGRDFRLDIPGEDISERELSELLIQDMRLLMVKDVSFSKKEIIAERHKRQPSESGQGSNGFVDLSHTIYDGLITYKGLPAPIICDYLSREASRERYAPGTEFQIGKIEMVANTGTYVDCPFHRYEDGKDLSEVRLERFADLEAVVIRADHRSRLNLDVESFTRSDLANKAVLIHTGWDDYWATDRYFENHPFLTEEAALFLKNSGASLVGIDSMNIDDTRGNSRPVHSILLASEILIVEHLCNLREVPDDGFRFSCIPPKFKGVGTFPVRAFARR
jgi:kynurenine formamidase